MLGILQAQKHFPGSQFSGGVAVNLDRVENIGTDATLVFLEGRKVSMPICGGIRKEERSDGSEPGSKAKSAT